MRSSWERMQSCYSSMVERKAVNFQILVQFQVTTVMLSEFIRRSLPAKLVMELQQRATLITTFF